MEIIKKIATLSGCYKEGRKIKIKGLMLHSVGCAQPDAMVFVNKWNAASNDGPSGKMVHAFIDANNGNVYEMLPWDYRAWHCGGSGNNTHIGVEMCESSYIKYTSGTAFEIIDKAKAIKHAKTAYDSAVALFTFLCKEYNLNPLTDICSHKEGYAKGIASGHSDPEHYWKGLGLKYTMDGFRKDVNAGVKANAVVSGPKETTNESYIWNYLKAKGLSDYAVAGIMGNLQVESGIRSNNLQNNYEKSLNLSDVEYTEAVDNGSYSKDSFIHDRAGYGLAQWTYYSRKENLYNYVKKVGGSIGEFKTQVDFFWKELSENYGAQLSHLKIAKSVAEASNVMLLEYEKPKNQSVENQKYRASVSETFYTKYAGKNQNDSKPVVNNDTFKVRVSIDNLNIRKGPGTNYETINRYTGKGVFTIVSTKSGSGSKTGWGKLKSGLGWISLDYCTRI